MRARHRVSILLAALFLFALPFSVNAEEVPTADAAGAAESEAPPAEESESSEAAPSEPAESEANRIDFAWHTNAIQDMMRFFPEKHLGEMKISALKRGGDGKEYEDLERIASEVELRGDEVEKDYLTFGRRKSNSVFVRVYNKTKEVVQMGYKQFFVLIWFQKGLISAFDKWVLEKVFEDGKTSWDYRHVARCKCWLRLTRSLYLRCCGG